MLLDLDPYDCYMCFAHVCFIVDTAQNYILNILLYYHVIDYSCTIVDILLYVIVHPVGKHPALMIIVSFVVISFISYFRMIINLKPRNNGDFVNKEMTCSSP